MIKKTTLTLLIALAALLIAGIAPASAQDTSGWFVYLYNGLTRDLVRINPDGSQQVYSLGLSETVFTGGNNMAFSADGSRLAICAVDHGAGAVQAPATLILRDLAAGANLLEVPLGTVLECQTSPAAFNEDESQIAVSIVNYVPGDPNMDTTGPAWRLLVLDVLTGNIVSELNPDSPAVAAVGITSDMPILPEVRHFTTDNVIFRELLWGVGGFFDPRAFRWQPSTGTLEQAPLWQGIDMDTLDGLMAWNAINTELPAGPSPGPFALTNVVMMADASGSTWMVYHDPEWMVGPVRFINNGQQLAILLYPSYDPNVTPVPDAPATLPRWIALDRDGTTSELISLDYGDVVAAPGGYAIFSVTNGTTDAEPVVSLVVVKDNAGSLVWQAAGVGWELVWSAPTPVIEGLPPFPAYTPQ
jgi:hypothetical protein